MGGAPIVQVLLKYDACLLSSDEESIYTTLPIHGGKAYEYLKSNFVVRHEAWVGFEIGPQIVIYHHMQHQSLCA